MMYTKFFICKSCNGTGNVVLDNSVKEDKPLCCESCKGSGNVLIEEIGVCFPTGMEFCTLLQEYPDGSVLCSTKNLTVVNNITYSNIYHIPKGNWYR